MGSTHVVRTAERIPVEKECNRCSGVFIVYRLPKGHIYGMKHRTYDVCSECAAKEAARKFPDMRLKTLN